MKKITNNNKLDNINIKTKHAHYLLNLKLCYKKLIEIENKNRWNGFYFKKSIMVKI